MHLKLKQLGNDNKDEYQAFLEQKSNFDHLSFMHTWEWGKFMESNAAKFERLGVYEGEELVAVGQFVLKKLRFGSYWYCPRGLVLDYNNQQLITDSYDIIKKYFYKRDGAGYLKVDPDILRGDTAELSLDKLQPKQAYIFTQAERVWVVDLQKDEAELLAWLKEHGMRKKLPYYLRRATKDGVTVRASTKPEDLELFIEMLNKLHVKKGGIGKHPDDYYRKQFVAMAPKGYEKLFFAEKDGQVLAASLVGVYGKEGSYLHAASTDIMRDLSAPHLLQYEVMKYIQANNPGIVRYNFWGIVSDKNRQTSHPRNGYSEFKRSFGGYKLEYIRARDFVYKPMIWRIAWALDVYRTKKYKND
jgi:lipid II:glycine glycyltransferase (peptidoglycan interpeptide bridge formation enzyme)